MVPIPRQTDQLKILQQGGGCADKGQTKKTIKWQQPGANEDDPTEAA